MTCRLAANMAIRARVEVAIYIAAFTVCMLCIQKMDDYGSAWRKQNKGAMNCTLAPDGAVMSPVCTELDMGAGWAPAKSLGSDPAFCTPHAPWFWYDLGGTMCVCEKKWSRSEYWEKVMTSFAFNFPHFMTPFQIYIVYQEWQWVFMYITFNEVFKEVCLSVTGRWGFTYDPPYDLEPRYDSFIRDVLLCGFPGLVFGILFVRVMKVPRFMLWPLKDDWEATDRYSKRYHLKIIFQMLALKQIALVYNTDLGTNTFYPQNILLITMNLTLIFGFYMHNKKDWPPRCHANIGRVHAAWALVITGIWLLTVYPLLDEMYLLCVAVALVHLLLLGIYVATRHSDTAALLLLGLERATVGMSAVKYNAWVDYDFAVCDKCEKCAAYESTEAGEEASDAVDACDLPLRGRPAHATAICLGARQFLYFVLGLLCGMLLLFGLLQPFTYSGLMYRRHWCGVIMPDGGNGCLFM